MYISDYEGMHRVNIVLILVEPNSKRIVHRYRDKKLPPGITVS